MGEDKRLTIVLLVSITLIIGMIIGAAVGGQELMPDTQALIEFINAPPDRVQDYTPILMGALATHLGVSVNQLRSMLIPECVSQCDATWESEAYKSYYNR